MTRPVRPFCCRLLAPLILPLAVTLSSHPYSMAGAMSPPPQRAAPPSDPKSTCRELLARLDALLEKFPEDLRKSKLDAREVPAMGDEIMGLCAEYLRECPTTERASAVRYQLARFSTMNLQRYLVLAANEAESRAGRPLSADAIEDLRRQYVDRVLEDLRVAEAGTASPELRKNIANCRGSLYYLANDFARSVSVYEQMLVDHPDAPDTDRILTSLVGALEATRQFPRIVEICDRFLEHHLSSPYTPHIIDYKGKMLLYCGDLERAVEHFQAYLPVLMRAYGGLPIGENAVQFAPEDRKDFETYIDRFPFQLALAQYALGAVEDAHRTLRSSVERLQAKAQRNALGQVGQVFLGRSQQLLAVVESLHGRPAPQLGDTVKWIGDSLDLETERGNVVLLLFFPYDNPRSEEYLQAVQSFVERHRSDGVAAAWIVHPKGKRNFPGQVERVAENRARLGLTMPVGLIEAESIPPSICRDYHVGFPTPTCVVLDRAGRVAWYKDDPTFRDFEISNRVVRRILAEPRP